jgi:hypothetical protein
LDGNDAISRDNWSLKASVENAIEEAWGAAEWTEEMIDVGTVNHHSIERKCLVASRKSRSEGDE